MPNAKDLVLKLRSVTDGFKTDQPVRELDDLEHSLKATGDQSTQSAREVKRAADDMDAPGFDRAAAEAETTARRMSAAADDMAAGMRDGARKIDAETDKMRQDLGEAGKETGAEFVGNIAEGIGSGQANLSDVVSGTLGGLTNLAATLTGPVGIAAGVAAAGIGLVFAKVKAEAEAAKERVQTLIGALEELGETTSKQAKEAIFQSWLDTMKEMPGELDKVRSTLQTAGINAKTFRDAISGSAAAQQIVREKLQATRGDIEKVQFATGTVNEQQRIFMAGMDTILGDLDEQNSALDTTQTYFDNVNGLTKTGKSNIKDWKDGIREAKEEARLLNGELDKAARDRTTRVTVKTVDYTGRSVSLPDPRKYPTNVHGGG